MDAVTRQQDHINVFVCLNICPPAPPTLNRVYFAKAQFENYTFTSTNFEDAILAPLASSEHPFLGFGSFFEARLSENEEKEQVDESQAF